MKRLVLLVIVQLVTGSDLKLGDRIIATEEECDRMYKLHENWNTGNFHEQVMQYVDLYFICQDSLNEDKYAYIDENKVDLSWYPGKDDKFPVMTSEGEKFVTKPPQRKPKDKESMKKKLAEYIKNSGGRLNPVYRLMSVKSELGQVIVDKQIECEVLSLFLLHHPDDKDKENQHSECVNELNCIKEKFMKQHKYTRKMYPEFFPILYKRRGTMIKTPPKTENSICESPESPEGNKKELEKWVSGVEFIGEKIANIGEVGTDFVEKLVKKGMGGGDKVLTKDEFNDLMTDVQSVTISDVDEDDDDDEDDENTYKVYGDVMLAKLAELEAKGIEIAHEKIEKVKPAIGKVESLASAAGEGLKKLEEVKLKPAIKKTTQGLSKAESNLKEKSINAYGEVKDGLTTAGSVAKIATSKAKEGGSSLINKLTSKHNEEAESEETTEILEDQVKDNKDPDWLNTLVNHMIQPDYLPQNYDNIQQPSVLKILRELGGREEDEKDKNLSDRELAQMLKSVKESTKKRAKRLNLKKDEIKQAADIVKGVMHALLYAAGRGFGKASDMTPQEIETAKSKVDQMVDFATAEILGEDDENDEDKTDHKGDSDVKGNNKENKDKGDSDVKGNNKENKDIVDASPTEVTKPEETPTSSSNVLQDHGESLVTTSDQDTKTAPLTNQEADQTATNSQNEKDESEEESEKEHDGKNNENSTPDEKQEGKDTK